MKKFKANELKKQGKISSDGKCLVVAKSSLKVQWKREIERFSKLKAGIVDTYKKTIGNLAIKKKALEEPELDEQRESNVFYSSK